MDKLITFAIPCYNSGAFMHHCIDSLLGAGDDIEIIIVNDGSSDNTGEVADEYARKYPDIIRAVHQENGGHGEGVNQGMRGARGMYYKVVDSDDRLDPDALAKFLTRLRETVQNGQDADMYVCNYVYVRIDTGDRRTMSYKHIFPQERLCTWEETRPFGPSQYLMMHSVVYRTALLREHGIELPKHTFYVDNLYMYEPFPYVKRIYYMDLDLYLYYVGSDEQSVSEKNMIKRIDQQIKVAKLMIQCHDLNQIKVSNRRLYRYMLHELAMMINICCVFLLIGNTQENLEKQRELWKFLRDQDIHTYRKLKYSSLSAFMNLPGKLGRKTTVGMYRLVHKIYKFN
ncbi:putative glycosyltransferase EpsJ [Clostridiales bacterium]|nr:glycosyltransferase [Clostridiales bacterium]GFI56512.1 putative glycosyltransferase EpsJ [Clostridiales bacterium]